MTDTKTSVAPGAGGHSASYDVGVPKGIRGRDETSYSSPTSPADPYESNETLNATELRVVFDWLRMVVDDWHDAYVAHNDPKRDLRLQRASDALARAAVRIRRVVGR